MHYGVRQISLDHLNLLDELRMELSGWRNYLQMNGDAYIHLPRIVTSVI